MDNDSKKENKKNKYRKTEIKYSFKKPIQTNKKEYQILMLALAKKNYINKLFDKENIKNNKINKKLLQFLGEKKIKNTEDFKSREKDDKNQNNDKQNDEKKKEINNTIKENYDNGLEVEIIYEEKTELVKTFSDQFLKSL